MTMLSMLSVRRRRADWVVAVTVALIGTSVLSAPVPQPSVSFDEPASAAVTWQEEHVRRRPGIVGEAGHFSGRDSSLVVPLPDGGESGADQGTVQVWLKPAAKAGTVIAYSDGGRHYINHRLSVEYEPENECVRITNRKGAEEWPYRWTWGSPKGSVPIDKWSLVTVTQDGSRVRLYVNGREGARITTGADPGAWTSAQERHANGWIVGHDLSKNDKRAFRGLLDEIVLLDTVLSAEKIHDYYASATGTSASPAPAVSTESATLTPETLEPIPSRITGVRTGTRDVFDLCGTWEFAAVPTLAEPPATAAWSRYEVTGSCKSKHKILLKQDGWYRKRLFIPERLRGQRIVVRCERVYFTSHLYVNGRKVGRNREGFLPFEYDVSDVVRFGAENELLLGVQDGRSASDAAKVTDDPAAAEARGWQQDTAKLRCPTGSNIGWFAGIWGPIRVEARPQVSIADVFVITSVAEKRIEVRTTVRNQSAQPCVIDLGHDVLSQGARALRISSEQETIPAGQECEIRASASWENARYWSPEDPYLYVLQTDLRNDEDLLDRHEVRFGFREFRIDGQDFRLNGRKVRLRSVWGHLNEYRYFHNGAKTAREVLETFKHYNLNSCRFHGVAFPPEFLDAADEVGLLIILESSVYQRPRTTESLDHTRRWVLRDRNHPCIAIWSGTNEFRHWCVPRNNNDIQFLISQQALIRELDPTRPVYQSGFGALDGKEMACAIHYPETLRNIVPVCYTWPSNPAIPTNRHHPPEAWNRNGPLCVGEDNDRMTLPIWAGDRLYQDRISEHLSAVKARLKAEVFRMKTEVYRLENIAVNCPQLFPPPSRRMFPAPILPATAPAYAPFGVYLKEYDRHLWADEPLTRTAVCYNDTLDDLELRFEWRLCQRGVVLDSGVETFPVRAGEYALRPLRFAAPAPSGRDDLELTMLLYSDKSHAAERRYAFSVFSREMVAGANRNVDYQLYDPEGRFPDSLRVAFPNSRRVTALTGLSGDGILVVGPDVLAAAGNRAHAVPLAAFVEQGGRVLVLEQSDIPDRSFPIPIKCAQEGLAGAATVCFPGVADHPILKGLTAADLRFWRDDLMVVRRNLVRPGKGAFLPVVNSGTSEGMERAPLVVLPHGRGCYVISQLLLAEKAAVEPVASRVFGNCLGFLHDFVPREERRVGLLADEASDLYQTLMHDLKCHATPLPDGDPGDTNVVLADADAVVSLDTARRSRIRAWIQAGGELLVHGVTPRSVETVSDLAGGPLALVAQEGSPAVLFHHDPLTRGVLSYDVSWRKNVLAHAIRTDAVPGARALAEPAGLVTVPCGKGRVIVNQFMFEKNLFTQGALRYPSLLLSNFGVRVAAQEVRAGAAEGHFMVDLRPYCNMGFRDEVKGDGKGGWTDEGENDMRKLPPGTLDSHGTPFQLIDPARNHGASCIVLSNKGAQKDGTPLASNTLTLTAASGIKVGHKAYALHFLHASALNRTNERYDHGPVAVYQVNYADGTMDRILVREKQEVINWWNVPKDLPNAKLAWAGPNLKKDTLGIYHMRWDCPSPEKVITSIDILGGGNPARTPILLAVTGTESKI